MDRRLLPVALVLVAAAGASRAGDRDDARVAWLREHAVPLASAPEPDDLSDLEPLREVLRGTRLVLLGEATRGDGSSFLAKARIVRFLHEEMGFGVLALECGLWECDRAWRRIRAGEEAGAALGEALFPLYMQSAQFQPVVRLVEAGAGSGRPLAVAGYDGQLAPGGGDFRSDLETALARPISFKELRGRWPRHLDGLLFLRSLESSRRIPPPA